MSAHELVLHMAWGLFFFGISLGMLLGMAIVEGWTCIRSW